LLEVCLWLSGALPCGLNEVKWTLFHMKTFEIESNV